MISGILVQKPSKNQFEPLIENGISVSILCKNGQNMLQEKINCGQSARIWKISIWFTETQERKLTFTQNLILCIPYQFFAIWTCIINWIFYLKISRTPPLWMNEIKFLQKPIKTHSLSVKIYMIIQKTNTLKIKPTPATKVVYKRTFSRKTPRINTPIYWEPILSDARRRETKDWYLKKGSTSHFPNKMSFPTNRRS